MYEDEIPVGRAEDLTGKQFGEWTVLYRTFNNSVNRPAWKCKCSCGNICSVNAKDLKRGSSTKCIECRINNRRSNLIGQKFGKLTVIELAQTNPTKWKCKCECGNETVLLTKLLTMGHTRSCGCYKAEATKNACFKDISGQRFGRLVALYPIKKENYVTNSYYWHCKCDCGNEKDIIGTHLRSGETLSCGCLFSKGQFKINNLLNKYQIPYITEYSFSDCRFPDTGYFAKFDTFVNNNYIIEYDGIQHYKIIDHFETNNSYKERKIKDDFKTQYCKEHNIPLIRIPYTALETFTIEDLIPETSKYLVKGE